MWNIAITWDTLGCPFWDFFVESFVWYLIPLCAQTYMHAQSVSLCEVWKFHLDAQRSGSDAEYEHLLRTVNLLSSHQEMANQLLGSSLLTWMDHEVNSYFQSKVLSQAFFITIFLPTKKAQQNIIYKIWLMATQAECNKAITEERIQRKNKLRVYSAH